MSIRVWMSMVAILASASLSLAACGDDEGSSGTNTGSGSGTQSGTASGSASGTQTGSGSGTATGMEPFENNCDISTATMATGGADITWTLGVNDCLIVNVGDTVTWTGSFTSHPLSGGLGANGAIGPMPDPNSPITTSDQSGATASVTFDTAGTYPYYCTIHVSSMLGTIYVVEP